MNNSKELIFRDWKFHLDVPAGHSILTNEEMISILYKDYDTIALINFQNDRVEIGSSSYCAKIAFNASTKEFFISQKEEEL
ncbi:hypothetical protein [Macrococcus brunensis]|uniref:hypothetical protein n=1 Tax=Macrococcus brunensis TaxID=198483 RepID=UPI001EF14111|nr:hypothetical protein [Macrococcus brunensis]ULG72001.1 hypothetical protein MGG12_00310 [Macrococcus brunensis]